MSDSNLIAELFARDPLNYEDKDLDTIIEHFRGHRTNFQTAHKTTKSATQTKKVLKGEEQAKKLGLDLDEIKIEL
jgi:hypothetical protein